MVLNISSQRLAYLVFLLVGQGHGGHGLFHLADLAHLQQQLLQQVLAVLVEYLQQHKVWPLLPQSAAQTSYCSLLSATISGF